MSVIIQYNDYIAEYITDNESGNDYVNTAINKAENDLDSITGGKLLICWNETDPTSPNYRNDTQKGWMKKAVIEQTRLNITNSNDVSDGQTSIVRGSISYTENRPMDRVKISKAAERYLEMAEIYTLSKLGAIRLRGDGACGGRSGYDILKDYVKYEIGDKRYVMVNPTNPVKGGQILAIQYHGDVPYAEWVWPSGIESWCDKILDKDDEYHYFWEAPSFTELDDKKLDKPTEAGDSTYSQALVPEVIDVNEVKITNKLNDLLTHQKVDVPFHIDLENIKASMELEGHLKLKAQVPEIWTIKGKVDTADDLPTEGNTEGDTYYVVDDTSWYIWTDEAGWLDVSASVNMDNYYTKAETNNIIGDLTELKTTDTSNVVNAINSTMPDNPLYYQELSSVVNNDGIFTFTFTLPWNNATYTWQGIHRIEGASNGNVRITAIGKNINNAYAEVKFYFEAWNDARDYERITDLSVVVSASAKYKSFWAVESVMSASRDFAENPGSYSIPYTSRIGWMWIMVAAGTTSGRFMPMCSDCYSNDNQGGVFGVVSMIQPLSGEMFKYDTKS